MRLTDRPLRPLFPKGFRNEVQIIATTLSADRENQPDTLITVGASAALMISDIPFNGPVSSVRVTRLDGEFIVNPTFEQAEAGDLDIIVAGTRRSRRDGRSRRASRPPRSSSSRRSKSPWRRTARSSSSRSRSLREAAPVKKPFAPAAENAEASTAVNDYLKDRIDELVATAASERSDANKADPPGARSSSFGEQFKPNEIGDALYSVIKKAMRKRILEQGRRADGRDVTQIRDLDIHVGVLPRTHGTGLFTARRDPGAHHRHARRA